MKLRNIIVFIILAGAGWFGYQHFMGGAPAGGPQDGAVPVSVAEVVAKDVTVWSEFSGRLEAVDRVEIRPRVGGMIDAVHFSEGAMVKKGDKLFTIDPRFYDAELALAKSNYASMESSFSLAKINEGRAAKLVKERAISQAEYDRRSNDLKVAQANLDSAKAALEAAKLNVEYAHITAPISGRVSRAEITAGNIISTSPAPLLTTIVSQNPIYVNFEVDERTFLTYVSKAGSDNSKIPVELGISSETGTPHKGIIKSFDNQLNTGSGTIRVRAQFDNDDGALLPGLFARVRLGSAGTSNAVLVNDKAIGTDQSKKFVWVVNAENKAVWREVKLGSMSEGLRIITEGLSGGEKIIIGGVQRIQRPDTLVAPEMVEMLVDSRQSTVDKEKNHAQ